MRYNQVILKATRQPLTLDRYLAPSPSQMIAQFLQASFHCGMRSTVTRIRSWSGPRRSFPFLMTDISAELEKRHT